MSHIGSKVYRVEPLQTIHTRHTRNLTLPPTSIEATWDAVFIKVYPLLETCWHLPTYFSHSIKSVYLLHWTGGRGMKNSTCAMIVNLVEQKTVAQDSVSYMIILQEKRSSASSAVTG